MVVDGWFVLREKYCWLVADKQSEQDGGRRVLQQYFLLMACEL
jgi:hypothetical protein